MVGMRMRGLKIVERAATVPERLPIVPGLPCLLHRASRESVVCTPPGGAVAWLLSELLLFEVLFCCCWKEVIVGAGRDQIASVERSTSRV